MAVGGGSPACRLGCARTCVGVAGAGAVHRGAWNPRAIGAPGASGAMEGRSLRNARGRWLSHALCYVHGDST